MSYIQFNFAPPHRHCAFAGGEKTAQVTVIVKRLEDRNFLDHLSVGAQVQNCILPERWFNPRQTAFWFGVISPRRNPQGAVLILDHGVVGHAPQFPDHLAAFVQAYQAETFEIENHIAVFEQGGAVDMGQPITEGHRFASDMLGIGPDRAIADRPMPA